MGPSPLPLPPYGPNGAVPWPVPGRFPLFRSPGTFRDPRYEGTQRPYPTGQDGGLGLTSLVAGFYETRDSLDKNHHRERRNTPKKNINTTNDHSIPQNSKDINEPGKIPVLRKNEPTFFQVYISVAQRRRWSSKREVDIWILASHPATPPPETCKLVKKKA